MRPCALRLGDRWPFGTLERVGLMILRSISVHGITVAELWHLVHFAWESHPAHWAAESHDRAWHRQFQCLSARARVQSTGRVRVWTFRNWPSPKSDSTALWQPGTRSAERALASTFLLAAFFVRRRATAEPHRLRPWLRRRRRDSAAR